MSQRQPQKIPVLSSIILYISASYVLFLVLTVLVLILLLVVKYIYIDSLPLYEPQFEIQEIKVIRMVNLADSSHLDQFTVYETLEPTDYSIVLETLNYLSFHVDRSPKRNITNTDCFYIETVDGESELLCDRGFFKIEEGVLITGYFRHPEVWSSFDRLWRACIKHRFEP